jgi:hypothetical protein
MSKDDVLSIRPIGVERRKLFELSGSRHDSCNYYLISCKPHFASGRRSGGFEAHGKEKRPVSLAAKQRTHQPCIASDA